MIIADEGACLLQPQTDLRRGDFEDVAQGFRALLAGRPAFLQPRRQLVDVLRRSPARSGGSRSSVKSGQST